MGNPHAHPASGIPTRVCKMPQTVMVQGHGTRSCGNVQILDPPVSFYFFPILPSIILYPLICTYIYPCCHFWPLRQMTRSTQQTCRENCILVKQCFCLQIFHKYNGLRWTHTSNFSPSFPLPVLYADIAKSAMSTTSEGDVAKVAKKR